MARSRLGIVIPIKNEEKTIRKLIQSVIKFGDVIVVNDCSDDNSLKILKKFKLKIINNKSTLGYEKTVLRGIQYCFKQKYKYIATIDGDGQHNPNFLKNIIKIRKFELLIASRNEFNRFSEYIFSSLSKIIMKIEDPLSGMKVYTYNTLNKLKRIESYNTLNTFILYDLSKHCKKIYQIPSK